jgi:GntR family transcriptional regulator, transcriptional repressor for pyruvate dehydrogenase complex
MGLQAVKKKRVHEEITAQIRRQLAEGRWEPGDRLPAERDLAETFQVSRSSVREAIRALESMGLVRIRTGAGTFVASTSESLLSPLVSAILSRHDLLSDTFETRRAVEPEIAALAARRATAIEIGQMQEVLEEQARQIARGESGVEGDTAFHSLLTRSVKNKIFLRLDDVLVDILRESREQSLQIHGRPSRSLAGHRQILRAIRARAPARARRAMLQHLTAIERNILRFTNANGRGRRRERTDTSIASGARGAKHQVERRGA